MLNFEKMTHEGMEKLNAFKWFFMKNLFIRFFC